MSRGREETRKRRARAISNGGAVDLSRAGLSDEQAAKDQELYELTAGLRCSGCKRRIGLGFHFTSIDPRDEKLPVRKLAACTREDCDFATKAREGATLIEAVEYAWADPAGLDARPADIDGVQFVATQ